PPRHRLPPHLDHLRLLAPQRPPRQHLQNPPQRPPQRPRRPPLRSQEAPALSKDLRAFDQRAAPLLQYPVIEFSAIAIQTIADAFAQVIKTCKYTCYACAILPDHVHLLIRKHKHAAEEMIRNLQRESHLLLRDRHLFDLEHPIWDGHGYSVFLD